MCRPLFVVLVAAHFVISGGTESVSAGEPATYRSSLRKAAIENILDAPLNWELGDREHVTLAELIEYVREEHQLQVRWDVSSLGMLYGDEAPLGDLLSTSLGGQASCSPPLVTNGLTTYPSGTSLPGNYSSQAQYQQPNAYGAPTLTVAPATPYGPNPGPAIGAAATSPTPQADNRFTAPVREVPQASQNVPANSGQPPPAPQVADDRTVIPSPETPLADQPVPDAPTVSGSEATIAKFQTSSISLSAISLERATVREALHQLLDVVSIRTSAIPFQVGLPLTTRAMALDLLVDENSVLITTQLRANAKKETRIYRLGSLSEIPVESLERIITHSIRPWSWRNQANEIAEQLASRWPKTSVPLPNIELNATEGITLKPAENGAATALSGNAMPNVSASTVAATGQLVAGGALATVHSIVAALEIVHHGDPPTGVIESLPGILIITQSQAAHREIQELLIELGED